MCSTTAGTPVQSMTTSKPRAEISRRASSGPGPAVVDRAGPQVEAAPTEDVRIDRDALPDFDVPQDVAPDSDHVAGQFVAADQRERPAEVAVVNVLVGSADPAGANPDQDVAR